jgi:hypothetical protein
VTEKSYSLPIAMFCDKKNGIKIEPNPDYSRVEVNLVVRLGRREAQRMKFGWLGRVGGRPLQILCNKADIVRSARL